MKYNTVPVDDEAYDMIRKLCVAYEMGKRGNGALVKKLVKAEYERLAAVKLIAPVEAPKTEQPQA